MTKYDILMKLIDELFKYLNTHDQELTAGGFHFVTRRIDHKTLVQLGDDFIECPKIYDGEYEHLYMNQPTIN